MTEEKNNYISLAATLIVTVPYYIYVFLKFRSENFGNTDEELKFWAVSILLLIPLRIISEIVIHIVAAIGTAIATGNENFDEIRDERDTLIDLKSNRNAYFTFCIGFLGAIITVAYSQSITTMFVIFILIGFVAELVDIFSKILYYKKGV